MWAILLTEADGHDDFVPVLLYNFIMEKKDLRKRAKEIRATLNISVISQKIVEQIVNLPEFMRAENVLLFYPKDVELNLLSLCTLDKNFYLPRIYGNNLLICPYSCEVDMQISKFNTKEPCSEPVSPQLIDFAIIPCLMADKKGYRLGYGGGFYDRLIPQLRDDCIKIVPCPSELFVDRLPIENFDKPVDFVCTEKVICK